MRGQCIHYKMLVLLLEVKGQCRAYESTCMGRVESRSSRGQQGSCRCSILVYMSARFLAPKPSDTQEECSETVLLLIQYIIVHIQMVDILAVNQLALDSSFNWTTCPLIWQSQQISGSISLVNESLSKLGRNCPVLRDASMNSIEGTVEFVSIYIL